MGKEAVPFLRIFDSHQFHQMYNSLSDLFRRQFFVVNAHGFRDLSADGDRGIQRSHGILKYHGKQRAAELSHLFLAVICDVRVVDLYRACLDVCVFGDQFHDGPAEDTFSAAGFSDDGQSFSGFQRKRDVPKSFDLAVRSVETDR